MIQHTFSAEGFEHTDKLQKYVDQKAKDIEKYVPRFAREIASLKIRISKSPKRGAEMYTCHLEMDLPKQKLVVTEKVEHAYAALDVTITELKRQLGEYKDKHGRQSLRHRAVNAVRKRLNQDEKLSDDGIITDENQTNGN